MTRTQLTDIDLFDIQMVLLKEDRNLEEQKLIFDRPEAIKAIKERIERNTMLLEKIGKIRKENKRK